MQINFIAYLKSILSKYFQLDAIILKTKYKSADIDVDHLVGLRQF